MAGQEHPLGRPTRLTDRAHNLLAYCDTLTPAQARLSAAVSVAAAPAVARNLHSRARRLPRTPISRRRRARADTAAQVLRLKPTRQAPTLPEDVSPTTQRLTAQTALTGVFRFNEPGVACPSVADYHDVPRSVTKLLASTPIHDLHSLGGSNNFRMMVFHRTQLRAPPLPRVRRTVRRAAAAPHSTNGPSAMPHLVSGDPFLRLPGDRLGGLLFGPRALPRGRPGAPY